MKTIMALLASCMSIWAAETHVQVASTSGTNVQFGFGWTKDVFTRDGQTNLVRTTRVSPEGVSQIARFYHDGELVGNFVSDWAGAVFNSEAGSYCTSLQYGPAGGIRSAKVGDKQGMPLDEFVFTNGNFQPIEGPLSQNGLMKPKFGDESKFIKEKAAEEARLKEQAADKDGQTKQ